MKTNRRAFTLIELLIVVSVIAVLAAIAVPNFLEAQTRSKVSRTKSDHSELVAALRSYYTDYHAFPPQSSDRSNVYQYLSENPNHTFSSYLESLIEEASELDQEPEVEVENEVEDDVDGMIDPFAPGNMPSFSMGMGAFGMGGAAMGPAGNLQTEDSELFKAHVQSGYDLWPLTSPVAYMSTRLPVEVFDFASWNSGGEFRNVPPMYLNLYELPAPKPGEDGEMVQRIGERYLILSPGPATNDIKSSENPVVDPLVHYDPTNGTISMGTVFRVDR